MNEQTLIQLTMIVASEYDFSGACGKSCGGIWKRKIVIVHKIDGPLEERIYPNARRFDILIPIFAPFPRMPKLQNCACAVSWN